MSFEYVKKYKLLCSARQDIKDILLYGYEQWGVLKANLYTQDIFERFEWLAQFPEAAKPRNDIKEGYRSWLQGVHIIYFRQQSDCIEILGIFHQREDVNKAFLRRGVGDL